MSPPARLHALAAFLPDSLVRALAEDASRPREGARREQPGAVLFADLSGFTPLAEALDREGPSGAERLGGILRDSFSSLLDTLQAHGGDVLRFAGDALVALWPAESAEALPHAVRLAAQCAQAAQALLQAREPVDGVRPRLKVGIGAGAVQLSDVGGEKGRWDFLASGAPLREMAQAEHAASPGEVLLGPQAWRHVEGVARGEPRAGGSWRLVALEPLPLPSVARMEPPPHLERALRAYLPVVVTRRLEAGHDQWLSEFRTATVLFINLSAPDFAIGQRPEALQRALRATQSVLFRYEGSANQVVVDDKGVVLVAAFGLPPFAHEDDASRAVQAALDVRAALRAQEVPHRQGLATGRVFCGTTGGASRREYLMVGHTVNLAARLMQAAGDDVLCDAATLRLASRLRFETLAPLKMKGITQPVPVFRPEEGADGEGISARGSRVVGRQEERARLAAVVRALAERGAGNAVLLEGEAGIGKSTLVGELLERATAAGLATATGAGNAVESSSAYHAWRPVLARLLGLERLPDEASRVSRLLARLRPRPELEEWAPLLNGVLPVELPETEGVRALPAALRGADMRELLVQLVDETTRERPRVVVLEDAHWLDSSSWELVLAVQRRVKRLLLVLTTRPPGEAATAGYRQFRDSPGTVYLPLSRMPGEDVRALVHQRLGVRSLPPQVEALIRERAEGLPFFSEELACALRDAGHLSLDGGEARLVGSSLERMAMDLPGTLQGTLTHRIDRLTPQQQLTLKVASVLGRTFSFELLRAVHPVEEERATLPEQLAELERLELVRRASSEPRGVYAFKHVLIQEAAYHLMAFAQRRELHRAAALLLERELEARGEELLSLLAHHWKLAEEPARALEYLERAAEAASSRGATHETLAVLTQALELADSGAVPVEPLRRARWSARLGQAYQGLGELERSEEHTGLALRLLGHRLPASRVGWSGRLAWELARHVAHLVLGRWLPAPRPSPRRERLQLASGLYSTLAQQSFLGDRPLENLAANLAAINLAEAAREATPATMAYNALGFTLGVGRLHGLARLYFRRAHPDILQGAYHLCFGRWDEGLRRVEHGIDAARRRNDRHALCTGLEVQGLALELAREPGAAQDVRESLLREAQESSNVLGEVWALTGMVPTLLLLARLGEAVVRLGEAETLLPRADALAVLRYHCGAALVAWRTGERSRARAHVDEALRLLRRRSVVVWSDVAALGALVETCLALWEEAHRAGDSEAVEHRARALEAGGVLRKASRLYPVARSRAARLEGTRAWLEGRPERARAQWQRALLHARTYHMPTDEGLAHAELARRATEPHIRAEHLGQARHLFERLGALGALRALDV